MKRPFIILQAILLLSLWSCNHQDPLVVSNEVLKERIAEKLSDLEISTIQDPVAYLPYYNVMQQLEEKTRKIFSSLSDSNDQDIDLQVLRSDIDDYFNELRFIYDSILWTGKYNDRFGNYLAGMDDKDLVKNKETVIQQVRLSKLFVFNDLERAVHKNDLQFNNVFTVVVPEKTVLRRGETFESKIYIAGYDSTRLPMVILDRGDSLISKNTAQILREQDKLTRLLFTGGTATFRTRCSKTGKHSYSGLILLVNNSGKVVRLPFRGEYTVIK